MMNRQACVEFNELLGRQSVFDLRVGALHKIESITRVTNSLLFSQWQPFRAVDPSSQFRGR
jgi:hypothetical protein